MSIVLGEFMNYNFKLGIIGAGNMAKAIVTGIVDSGVLPASAIVACDPNTDIGVDGVVTLRDNAVLLAESEFILLSVKPQIYNLIATEIASKCKATHIISIMAGVSYERIKADFDDSINITRVMPNMPCKHKLGMTAIRINNELSNNEKDFVESIFLSSGEVCYLEEEMFHTITSVSGSGPAYVYMFIEGMINSGVKNGLSYEVAKQSVLKTFEGAVSMIRHEDSSITELIDAVCSKGGTTIEAVESFRNDDLYGIIDSAMTKCRTRSEELGK